jgi:hypothetical protein
VSHAGLYGYVHVYGADDTEPPLPGFLPGESLAFRVNGAPITSSVPVTWTGDLTPRAVDLVESVYPVYLPMIVRSR